MFINISTIISRISWHRGSHGLRSIWSDGVRGPLWLCDLWPERAVHRGQTLWLSGSPSSILRYCTSSAYILCLGSELNQQMLTCSVFLLYVLLTGSSLWHIWTTILEMTCSVGWLAIVLIGSLIMGLISVHVCTPITFNGNFSWKLTAGGCFAVRNTEWPFASCKLRKFYVSF